MSTVNMFRKEALKKQYQGNNMGESVVVPSQSMNAWIITLLVFIVGLFYFAKTVSIPSVESLPITLSNQNFSSVLLPQRGVIQTHLVANGKEVKVGQNILTVQMLSEGSGEFYSKTLQANRDGFLFQSVPVGQQADAFSAVAYLVEKKHQYHFTIDASSSHMISGQAVVIEAGAWQAEGNIMQVSNDVQQRVMVKLRTPYDVRLLNPNLNHQLRLKTESKTILNMVGQKG